MMHGIRGLCITQLTVVWLVTPYGIEVCKCYKHIDGLLHNTLVKISNQNSEMSVEGMLLGTW